MRLRTRRVWRRLVRAESHLRAVVDTFDSGNPVLLAGAIEAARRYLRRV